MKVLFSLPEYFPQSGGGIATFYNFLLPELAKQGVEIHVIVGSPFTPEIRPFSQGEVKIWYLDKSIYQTYLSGFSHYYGITHLSKYLASAWAMHHQAQTIDYDLIDTTDWGLSFVPWTILDDSPPTLVQCHGSIGQIDSYDPISDQLGFSQMVRLIESSVLSLTDCVITHSGLNSIYWKNLLNRSVPHIPPAFPVFCDQDKSSQLGNDNPSYRGLVVGRIQYWKGVTILCEALKQIENVSLEIDWIGRDVVYQASNQSMSAYLSQVYPDIWGKKVRPLGTYSAEETRYFQSQAAFILLPSIWDVFNFTCVEGMVLGKPVLCSRGAGASELIEDGVNGFTFAPDDPADLALALRKVMSLSEQERQSMREAARSTIATQLDPVKIAQQRIEVYENLIRCGKSPQRPSPWLVNALSPQKMIANPLAFLDQLPLSELTQYLGRRFLKKVLK